MPIGSPCAANTIGMLFVAALAARVSGAGGKNQVYLEIDEFSAKVGKRSR